MALNSTIKSMAEKAGARLGLPARFIASWWVSENGWNDFPATNNPGNISYTPKDGEPAIPSGGLFEGVVKVEPNRVCVYSNPDTGVNAFVKLIEIPKDKKALSFDSNDLKAADGDIKKLCEIVGESNWASGHYRDAAGWEGSLIWDVYNSPDMVKAFEGEKDGGAAAVKKPEPTHLSHRSSYTIHPGDTLGGIALKFHVPLHVLQSFNDIKDANKIDAGATLSIPYAYRVKPGDTVGALAQRFHVSISDIAKANKINPDFIVVGWTLYV